MTDMLDPVVHARLIQNLEGVCERASIHQRWLHNSAATVCGPTELDWLINYRTLTASGLPGLRLLGPQAVDRCMAMAGALLRNFIDARVRTVDEMIDNPVDATVLLCPNFLITGSGKNMPSWRIQKLYDQLLERYKQEHPTIVWLQAGGQAEYGPAMSDLLNAYTEARPHV